MTLIHEIFATQDLSRVLALAMLASLGAGAGVGLQERSVLLPIQIDRWAAGGAGALAALALFLMPRAGGAPTGWVSAVLLAGGGAILFASVAVGRRVHRRSAAKGPRDSEPGRGTRLSASLRSGAVIIGAGLALAAAARLSLLAALATTMGVGIAMFLIAQVTNAELRHSAAKRVDRIAIHAVLTLVFIFSVVGAFWLLHAVGSIAGTELAVLLAGYFLAASAGLLLLPWLGMRGSNETSLGAFIAGLALFWAVASGLSFVVEATGLSGAVLEHPQIGTADAIDSIGNGAR